MRVVDSFTGREVRVGQSCADPYGHTWTLVALEDRFFSARALFEFSGSDRIGEWLVWLPLQVRFTHPKYFGRRVAFVPT